MQVEVGRVKQQRRASQQALAARNEELEREEAELVSCGLGRGRRTDDGYDTGVTPFFIEPLARASLNIPHGQNKHGRDCFGAA